MRAMRKKNVDRRKGDYYPSPPDAVLGLLDLVRSGFVPELTELYARLAPTLDPAAGAGTLLSWGGPRRVGVHFRVAQTLAIELHPVLAAECIARGHQTVCGDALAMAWPAAPLVIANPPFLLLRAFVDRILEHLRTPGRVGVVLHPSGWLKAAAQADLPVPDKGELSWRPHFTPRALSQSSPFQHYEWSVWTSMSVLRPRESGRYRRVLKPRDVPLWMVEEHEHIGGLVA